MEDIAGNIVAEIICTQCGTLADTGLIFCKKCGSALRPPTPLIQSGSQDFNPPATPISFTRRVASTIIKGLEGISVVVFVLCPLRTATQVVVFVASITVFLICHFVLTNLDETYLGKYKDGYWPPKPIDWAASAKVQNANEKRKS